MHWRFQIVNWFYDHTSNRRLRLPNAWWPSTTWFCLVSIEYLVVSKLCIGLYNCVQWPQAVVYTTQWNNLICSLLSWQKTRIHLSTWNTNTYLKNSMKLFLSCGHSFSVTWIYNINDCLGVWKIASPVRSAHIFRSRWLVTLRVCLGSSIWPLHK